MTQLRLASAVGFVFALALLHAPAMADPSDYSVRELLEPCIEGDNDSRGGAVLEMECEQYVSGFTDLYLRAGLDKADNVCLPPAGNRADEIRWAFMRWAHDNFDKRDMPAVEGLIATVKARFKCAE